MLLKRPNSEVFKINTDNFSSSGFDELIGGQSLFTQKYIVEIARVSEKEDVFNEILDKLNQLKESENVFIWIEPDIDAKNLKKIEKFAEKSQEFAGTKSSDKNSADLSSNFALTDAFGERNSKKLWLLYLSAVKNSAPEEIHGILWWQIKSMLIASQTNSAAEAGLKPFVYSKAKRYSKNFTGEELENLSREIVSMYHEARRGGVDLEARLEKFVLGI